ncbi:unnamed protein product [Paramecium octaurelia]|uniref:non-specific serine/threonine protein kinase n=1 Tax=Paramecium octaurelia TaxID=43137 RepID=A0A8S1UHD7_PAROT|nr:unnamed protein product [Paramecium octaurelia]
MNYDVRTIGDYEVHITKCIGQGSYGKVYDGRIISQNRIICVKVLHLTEEKRQMFLREVEILEEIKKVTHPNIVKIYHLAEQNQKIYIFMEKCKENLEQQIQKQKKQNQSFSVDQVLFIAKQICRGYNELRKKNIIHRDIKPENILLGEDGQYKISDYGLSKYQNASESTLRQTQLGTPLFVSPQVLFIGIYSNKADLFSLGLTIYYITFQEPIFKIKTLGELSNELNKIRKGLSLPQIKNQGDQNSKRYLEIFLKKTIAYEEEERLSWDEISRYLEEKNQNSLIFNAPPEQDSNKNKDTLGINLQRMRQNDADSVIYSIKPTKQETTQTLEQQPLEPYIFIKNTNQDSQNISQRFQQNLQIKQNQDQNGRQIQDQNQIIDNLQLPQQQCLETRLNHPQISLFQVQDTQKDVIISDVCDSQFDQSKENNYLKQNNNPNIIKQNISSSQYTQEIIFRRDFQESQDISVVPQNNYDDGLNIGYDNDSYNSANHAQQQIIFLNYPDQLQNQIPQVFKYERRSDCKDFFIKNNQEPSESIINFNNIDPYEDENYCQIQNQLSVSKQNNQQFDEQNCSINYNADGKNNQLYDLDNQLSLNHIDSQSEVISESYKLSETTQRDCLNTQNKLQQTSNSELFEDEDTFNQSLKAKSSIRSQFQSQTQQPNQIPQIKFSSTNKIQSTCPSDMIPQNKISNQTTNLAQFKYVKQNEQAQYGQQIGLNTQEIQSQNLQKERGFQKKIQNFNKQGNNTSYQYNQSKAQEFQNQNGVQKIELSNKIVEFSSSNDTQPENQYLNQQQMISNQNDKIQNGNQNGILEQGQGVARQKIRLVKKVDVSQQTQPLQQVFQIILAKIRLAENVFNSYQVFRTNLKFQKFTKQFEILNYLLHYYQYALIANIRLLLKNDKGLKECYLLKELDQYIVAGQIVDYQKSNQKQINEINEIYQEKLQISTQASKDFQDFLDSRVNNGDMLDVIRFIEEGKFFRYISYIELYEKYFKQIFIKFNSGLNYTELLKFFGYSIKFIKIDKEFPIQNFKIIDPKQIDYMTDSLETLQEFIQSYMNVK